MAAKPLEPGDPVAVGRFELLARLGEGGQGVVYLGRGTEPGEERVAVKVLRSSVDATVLERLARELDAVHQVQPFVTAGIIEASADGDRRYIVSEFIDGPSLAERIARNGPLRDGELHRLAVGTVTALTAIHGAGVVHRDFKPANVLLGPDGPRVVDFGIARLMDAATITSGVIGTPSFIAPEQLAGQRPTSAVDIFAWAVTIGYAATGQTAFGNDTVVAVMRRILDEEPDLTGVPASLLEVLAQCLAKDPASRPAARDLLLRLVEQPAVRPAGAAQPASPAPPDGPPAQHNVTDREPPPARRTVADREPPAVQLRRRTGLMAAGAAIVVVVAVILGVVLSYGATGSAPSAGGSPGRPSGSQQATSIPAGFQGAWAGTATMAPLAGGTGLTTQNSIGFDFGTKGVDEYNGNCDTTLAAPTQVTPQTLTFAVPDRGGCAAGTMTFTLHGQTLAYRWTDNAFMQQTGTLRRG